MKKRKPQEQGALALLAGILLLAGLKAVGQDGLECIFLPALLTLVLLPMPEAHKAVRRAAPEIVFWLGAPAAFAAVELMNETNLYRDFKYWQIIMNLIWYSLGFFLLRLLLGRRKCAGVTAGVLFFLVGLANHYVLAFRGRIIFPCDLDPSALQTAANVAAGYTYWPNFYVFRALIVLLCYFIALLRCPTQPKRTPLPRLVSGPLLLGYAAYGAVFFATPFLPACKIYTQQWKTTENGFLLNFSIAMRYSIVEKPEGYSAEAAQEIAARYSDTAGEVGVKPTNIICIMNESLADYAAFGDEIPFEEDPMPFLHSLRENTVSGMVYGPVTGGGTANVEFEYLTGNALAFLPINTVAYQLYLEPDTPSLVRQAASLGYTCTAFHPYKSSGWNRKKAYADLGFDKQMYEEDVQNPEIVRSFISDASDYEQLYALTDSTSEPQFIFNVTMQNHSGYQLGWLNLEKTITLPREYEKDSGGANQFFSLMRESDNALRELIGHYQASDEATMIVVFGDHQPPLRNSFYEKLYGKKLDARTTEEVMQQYTTPFFIWTNYESEPVQGMEWMPAELGAQTAKRAGFPLTGWQNFLLELGDTFAAINPVGFRTQDGRNVERAEELTAEEQKLVEDYRMMAYSCLFDTKERPADFFFLPGDEPEE